MNFTKLPALTPIPYIIPYPVISYVFFDEKNVCKTCDQKTLVVKSSNQNDTGSKKRKFVLMTSLFRKGAERVTS